MLNLDKGVFRWNNLASVIEAPPRIAGRALHVRARAAGFDLSLMCAYFPPRPDAKRKAAAYCATVDHVDHFLRERLLRSPARSTIIIGMDLNDGLGLTRDSEGKLIRNTNGGIGPNEAA